MTCANCFPVLSSELRAQMGAGGVDVDLGPAVISTVTVTSDNALSEEQVAAALDEAGDYHLATAWPGQTTNPPSTKRDRQ